MLEFPPSTYYAAKKRKQEKIAREIRDEYLKKEIMRAWGPEEITGEIRVRKLWRQLNRGGIAVARCTVEQLMRELGIGGVKAGRKRPRTTVSAPAGTERPSNVLERDFTAVAPNQRISESASQRIKESR
jgi:putative transposase